MRRLIRAWLAWRAAQLLLNEDDVRRLAAVGITSAADLRVWQRRWRRNRWTFWSRLENLEHQALKVAAQGGFERWSPQLRAFAAECRAASPPPRVAAMSAAEWAEYRVLLTAMREFATSKRGIKMLAPKRKRVVVIHTSACGLTAATEVFGQTGAVVLTTTEARQWWPRVVPPGTVHPYGWYELLWWDVAREDDEETAGIRARAGPPPKGTQDWIFTDGHLWGPLAGGGGYHRWRWDGDRLTYVDCAGGWIS